MHLLLGHAGDSCCAGVLSRLAARGLPARIVASPLAPPARFAWRLTDDGLTSRLDLDDDRAEHRRRPGAWYGLVGSRRLGARGSRIHAGGDARCHPRLAGRLALPSHQPPLRRTVVPRPCLAARLAARSCAAAGYPSPTRSSPTIPPRPTPSAAVSRPTASPAWSTLPLTGEAAYLVATDAAWQGLADLQERSPVCLSEPHGATWPACIVGGQIFWDDDPPPEVRALEPHLRRSRRRDRPRLPRSCDRPRPRRPRGL